MARVELKFEFEFEFEFETELNAEESRYDGDAYEGAETDDVDADDRECAYDDE